MNDPFLSWCDDRSAACNARCRALRSDNRADEARFEQVRCNVYGIYRAVYTTLHDKPDLLARKLAEIPAAWEQSLAQAQLHGDEEKAHIERIKLAAAEEIRTMLSNTGA